MQVKVYFRLVFIISFSLAISVLGHGQVVMLKGQLLDASTKEAVVGATVQVDESGSVSDLEGRFNLQINKSDSTEIVIKYVGYETVRLRLAIEGDTMILPTFFLDAAPKLIDEVTVTAGKFEKPLGESTVSIEILKPALLEQTNTTSIDDVLDKVPGVAIIDGQANIRGGSGFSYGAGSRVVLLLDDIPALQADAGFPTWDDFPVENIAQMEIVKGASSSLYGSSALNGVINVRTGYATDEPSTKISVFATSFLSPRDKVKKWWRKSTIELRF